MYKCTKSGLLKWFYNFFLLTEIFDKTTLPNSIFKFNPFFLVLLKNLICKIESTNAFENLRLKYSKLFVRKAATRLNS